MNRKEENLALADEIEASAGLFCISSHNSNGGHQLGIKKTAQVITALRAPAAPSDGMKFSVRQHISSIQHNGHTIDVNFREPHWFEIQVNGSLVLSNGSAYEAWEKFSALTDPEALPSDSRKADRLLESNYRAGLQAGWNFGLTENTEGMAKAMASHSWSAEEAAKLYVDSRKADEPVAWRDAVEQAILENPYTTYSFPAQNDAIERNRAGRYVRMIAHAAEKIAALTPATEGGGCDERSR